MLKLRAKNAEAAELRTKNAESDQIYMLLVNERLVLVEFLCLFLYIQHGARVVGGKRTLACLQRTK